MFGIFVNNELVGVKNKIESARFSFERLVTYFKSIKKSYTNLGINLEEKVIEIVNLEDDSVIEKTTISDL